MLSNVQGLWTFASDLSDSSGNGFDLSVQSGSTVFATVDGLPSVYLSAASVLERTVHDAALAITGDMTIVMLVRSTLESPAGDQVLVTFDGGDEAEANNTLYQIALDQTTSVVEYLAEESTGTDITHSHGVGFPVGSWHMITLVRSSDDVILYLDGFQAGANSSGLSTPTGGGTSVLTNIGLNFDGYIGGLAITSSAATANEIASLWAWVSNGGDSTRIYDLDPSIVPNVRGCWNFNDDLTDEGPYGLDLEWPGLTTNPIRYATIQGKRCAYFEEDDDVKVRRNGNDPELTITGALTMHVLYFLQREPTLAGGTTLVTFQLNTGSEAEADNNLYGLLGGTVGSNSSREWRYFAETGGGTNVDFTFQSGIQWGGWHLVTLVRDDDGDVILYTDGAAATRVSSGLARPTGGTTSELRVGIFTYGFMGGICIAAHESTASEVADMWAVVTGEASSSGEEASLYIMRGLESNVVNGEVTWASVGSPDFTGASSPYNPGDMSDIRLMTRLPGESA